MIEAEALARVPATTPFVGPEHLARAAGMPPERLLRLGANESRFGPAPAVRRSIERESANAWMYGDPEQWDLKTAIAARHGVPRENLLVAGGIDELLGLLVRGYCNPGDTCVMTEGSYPTFAFHARAFDCKIVTAPYRNGAPDLDQLLRKAYQARPRLVYLANPDNPGGGYLGPAEVERFASELPGGTGLLLDEAYAEFAPEPGPARLPEHVFRLRTFSKAYGLAGMRVGFAVVPASTVALCDKFRLHFGVPRISQIAALEALREPDHVASVIAETVRGRAEYAALAERVGLTVYPSATNFVLFKVGSVARAETLVAELLRRGVFIRKPGHGPLAGCVRVTVGTAEERARLAPLFAEALAATDAGGGA